MKSKLMTMFMAGTIAATTAAFGYVLSKEGQEIVVKDGYLPLPASAASKQKGMLD